MPYLQDDREDDGDDLEPLVPAIAAYLARDAMRGWLFSAKAFAPKFSRLNPFSGIKRMFSSQGLIELVKALGKALGTGVRAPVLLPDVSISHDELGKPSFTFAPLLAAHLAERGLTAHLSISDEQDYAVAFVILEKP